MFFNDDDDDHRLLCTSQNESPHLGTQVGIGIAILAKSDKYPTMLASPRS